MKFILDRDSRAINPALVQYFFVRAVPREGEGFAVTARFFYCLHNTGETETHDLNLAYFKTRNEAEQFLIEVVDNINAEGTENARRHLEKNPD